MPGVPDHRDLDVDPDELDRRTAAIDGLRGWLTATFVDPLSTRTGDDAGAAPLSADDLPIANPDLPVDESIGGLLAAAGHLDGTAADGPTTSDADDLAFGTGARLAEASFSAPDHLTAADALAARFGDSIDETFTPRFPPDRSVDEPVLGELTLDPASEPELPGDPESSSSGLGGDPGAGESADDPSLDDQSLDDARFDNARFDDGRFDDPL